MSLSQLRGRRVEILLRREQGRVAEQLLHVPYIHAMVEEMGRGNGSRNCVAYVVGDIVGTRMQVC